MNATARWFLGIMALGASVQVIRSAETVNATLPGAASAANDSNSTAIREEQLRKLRRDVDDAERGYVSASGEAESESRWRTYTRLNATNVPAVVRLASQDPISSTAFDSLVWVMTNRQVLAGSRRLQPCGLQAVELLSAHHYATNPAIVPVCRTLAKNWDCDHQPAITFLEEVISKNPDRNARGQATYALARLTKCKAERLGQSETAPENPAADRGRAGAEEAKKGSASTVLRDAERLFESVLRSYADCPADENPGALLGEMAAPELHEIQHLWTGKVAPDIEGEDLDGTKMKLSDFRGKVVMVSFWASWCGPCMAMVPLERRLSERMAGKPFALVGVNADANRADGRRAAEKEKVTWRSFWSGTNGSNGSIPAAWNVKGWPTVYVLDAEGTIRLKYRGYSGTNTANVLTETVDRLLKEPGEEGSKVQ